MAILNQRLHRYNGSSYDTIHFEAGADNITGTLPVAHGGTGSTTAAGARSNLEITPANIGAAPTSHAASATTYGAGTNTLYGHVRLSDVTNSTSSTNGGFAATPAAVKAAYDLASGKADALVSEYGSADRNGWYRLLRVDNTVNVSPITVSVRRTYSTSPPQIMILEVIPAFIYPSVSCKSYVVSDGADEKFLDARLVKDANGYTCLDIKITCYRANPIRSEAIPMVSYGVTLLTPTFISNSDNVISGETLLTKLTWENPPMLVSNTYFTDERVNDVNVEKRYDNSGTIYRRVGDNGTWVPEMYSDGVASKNHNHSEYAPTAHASTATTYGLGNYTNYGHLKLYDGVDSAAGMNGGIAATPSAVRTAYNRANAAYDLASKSISKTVIWSATHKTTAEFDDGVYNWRYSQLNIPNIDTLMSYLYIACVITVHSVSFTPASSTYTGPVKLWIGSDNGSGLGESGDRYMYNRMFMSLTGSGTTTTTVTDKKFIFPVFPCRDYTYSSDYNSDSVNFYTSTAPLLYGTSIGGKSVSNGVTTTAFYFVVHGRNNNRGTIAYNVTTEIIGIG